MKLLRIAATAVMTAGLLVPASASVAAPPSPVNYVALGDSYAAGVGAAPYFNGCAQSLLGYPELLDERKRIELTVNATCTGYTVAQVAGKLGSLSAETDLVTLTVGGNDVLYQQVIAVCAQGTAACEQAVAAAVAGAQTQLAGALSLLYGQINFLAPNAEVIVTGYPHLFSPEFGTTISIPGSPLVLTPTEQQLLNDGTDALNAVIRAQAEAAGFTYVDVVKRFDKHGLGSPQPWIQPFTDAGRLHPTAKGYQSGYLPEVRKAID